MKPFTLVCAFLFSASAFSNDWPTWRGPDGNGKLTEGAAVYPVEWSAEKNLKWRVDLPAPGNSSPIVVGDRVFVTLGKEKGKLRCLLCFSASDGSLLWEKSVDYGKEDKTHKTNPYSAASPVSDGESVYAWHGNGGLFAYDLEGNELWKRDLGTDYAHIWGPNAGSPVIYEDTLVLHAGPGLEVKLFGLNKKTGETVWEKDLPAAESAEVGQFKGSWATPRLVSNDGRDEVLIGLPKALRSFDPKSGKELWSCGGLGDLCYTNVLTDGKRVIYLSGFGGPGMGMTFPKASETGDVTAARQLWADQGKKGRRQRIGSGQIIGDYLYNLDEPGVMVCLEVETGKMLWEERLSKKSWSSMNLIGDKLFVNDELGTTYVIQPDPGALKLLHTNQIDKRQHTNSSLAFANGKIFQRTDAYLYAFGK